MKINWNLQHTYTTLPSCLYSEIKPTPVKKPKLCVLNKVLAKELGLDLEVFETKDGIGYLSGNQIDEESILIAQAYAGHQFGHFTMLGDGRAILLGEYLTDENKLIDIQLKGSGRTPYSRSGDGRAALGPMLREYLISEAMHNLGIPTTRSLAVIETGESVYRNQEEKGAVLTRLAASHIRVGTFEYIAKWGTKEELKALADYTINRHFSFILPDTNSYLKLLEEVVKRQAMTIAKWQLVGFIHGVMNTDNMTLSGETIDYGPCAFMDTYNVNTVFSSIDYNGRYAYGKQPQMGGWNLARLAEALLPLIHTNQETAVKLAEGCLKQYSTIYQKEWLEGMYSKLGLNGEKENDQELVTKLLKLMEAYKADFTYTFASLTQNRLEGQKLFEQEAFKDWYKEWHERIQEQAGGMTDATKRMKRSNPAVIMRNHLVEEALEMAVSEGSYENFNKLLEINQNPYSYNEEQTTYHLSPPVSDRPYRTFCGT